ncbi:flagellar filament capping protein FliD [Stieleria sp. ICT_E10.1]|uniref:flagellar filament capping protein FliD n=1 Tax=Stieleria sedimenti TaxID=2976331 RepID=UPI0021804EAC|nr:flagellar filament capping protein FliD [Stieleria sedimenti]MCS7469494.1 flagellar filament capping protein FliD [Stieleria sedimenti]
MFNIDGIVSGFDTSGIIDSLLGFQQQQIDKFNSRKAEVATKQTSFKGIEAQLVTLQSSLGRLNRATNSVFDARVASSTNEDVVTATAGSGAIASNYQISVEQLATAHQVASQGFSSTTDQMASGDITFKVGDRAEQTININASNNTLKGFVNTINEQVEDINASIVFDQAAGSHRILLSSKRTGAANTITVTSAQDPLTGVLPDFSGPAVQPPLNAIVKLGSGIGAISAEYDSNTVDGLIENVTLELNKADPGGVITIDIEADTESAKEAVQGFVDDFNSIIEFIDAQSQYNPETEVGNPLLGDRSASTIKNKLLTIVSETVPDSAVARLSEIGVDLNLQGKLAIDSEKLDKALNGELDGIDAKDIRNLFGLNAVSTSSGVRFLGGTGRTEPSQTPYEVDITQAAEQALVNATNAAAASIVVDGTNNRFEITVDSIVSESLTLTPGTYSTSELADHLESVINSSSTLGVHQVQVSVGSDNRLSITTEAYGSAANISSLNGTAASILGFTGSENDAGQNVAGRFLVNGVEEIAKGIGRILTGDPDNENTADLRVEVTLTAAQINSGSEAELTVTQGITGRLNDYIRSVLDAETGLLKTVNETFESRIASIDKSIEQVEKLTESKREYLIAEFTALESIINELQTTGNFISTQLTSLGNFSNNNKK